MAENFAFNAYRAMIATLQSMGYLPRVATGVVAKVVGAADGDAIPTFDELAKRLEALECVDKELGLCDLKLQKRRLVLKEFVKRGRTAAEIEQWCDEQKGLN